MSRPIRIAMWSGPRNISTAMMRAWGSRSDTAVCDEPLYAPYLLRRGVAHSGRDEVIAAHQTDWRMVLAFLTGPVAYGRRIFYQKHMSHHPLPGIDRGWLAQLTHAFLIRDPRQMLASLINVTLGPRRQVHQRPGPAAEHGRADAVFCTGTMGELVPVLAIDSRTIGPGRPGELARRLTSLFRALTARRGGSRAQRTSGRVPRNIILDRRCGCASCQCRQNRGSQP